MSDPKPPAPEGGIGGVGTEGQGHSEVGCKLGAAFEATIQMVSQAIGRIESIDIVHGLAHIMAEVLVQHDGLITPIEAANQVINTDDDRIAVLVEHIRVVAAGLRQEISEAAANNPIAKQHLN